MIKFNAIEHRYGIETRRSFEYTLDWLHEHACSRSYGLGMYQLHNTYVSRFINYWIMQVVKFHGINNMLLNHCQTQPYTWHIILFAIYYKVVY